MYFFNWIPLRDKIFLASNLCTSYISWREKEWRNNKIASMVLTQKICIKSAGFLFNWPCTRWFLASIQFPQNYFQPLAHSIKMCLPSAIWPNYCYPLTLKIFFAYGYSIKKSSQHSIIWRWAVLCKKQDGGWIKICETFSGNSLKEDLSIDTTFDPVSFHETVPRNI